MLSSIKITSGYLRGRKITFPQLKEIRPTPERHRQALFNILGNDLSNDSFLDLFSGSGIIGFEAMSRKAKSITFVDKSNDCIKSIKKNVKNLQINDIEINYSVSDYVNFLSNTDSSYDIIYLDPPFTKNININDNLDIYYNSAKIILDRKILNKKGILIIEFFSKYHIDLTSFNYNLLKEKIYGTSGISFWKEKENG